MECVLALVFHRHTPSSVNFQVVTFEEPQEMGLLEQRDLYDARFLLFEKAEITNKRVHLLVNIFMHLSEENEWSLECGSFYSAERQDNSSATRFNFLFKEPRPLP